MEIVGRQLKPLGVLSLTMMNVIAVDSLRNLAVNAEYGLSLVFFYCLVGLFFYIPSILVGAELSTAWPHTGGAYVWIREAFGKRYGFLAMWLQWAYNVVWFPTILSFIVGTVFALIHPAWLNQPALMLTVILVAYWLVTALNCFGIRVSAWLSISGACLGTLLPMLLIILLAGVWLLRAYPIQLEWSAAALLPNHASLGNLAFIVGLIFSLMGMEMSAVHAGDAQKPEKNYPRALLYSSVLIWLSMVLSSLAIAIVIPHRELNLVSGLLDAFRQFFSAFHLLWLLPFVALAMVFGCLASVSAWMVGPSRGLLIAAEDSRVMRFFLAQNRFSAPYKMLLGQGVVFTGLCSAFMLMKSINAAYWLLSALASQLALLYYLLLFAAALRLKYSAADVKRPFAVPFAKIGMWVVVGLGMVSCVIALLVGFQPPQDLKITNVGFYEAFLILGLLVFVLLPWVLLRTSKSSKKLCI